MKIKKAFLILILSVISVSAFAIQTSALSWVGSSAGGNGGGTAATVNGYAIHTTTVPDNCTGYRFSVVNSSGAMKSNTVIDVFRNTAYGNESYSAYYKFNSKYNKSQLKNSQNSGFSTGSTKANCYMETSMGFATNLAAPASIGTWQNNTTNLNRVLAIIGLGSISNLVNGDKVIVEPLICVKLQGTYHSLTITEIAIYGKYLLGANSNGGSSKYSGSWGFISDYTNKRFPNLLYTPDGKGLWANASEASSRLTFYTMINSGYGVGIAYTETKPSFSPILNVIKCEAWPGEVSTRNSNHYGISYGNAFANYTYGNGYPIMGDKVWFALNFPAETENCYVRQSVWVVGGEWVSRNVWLNSNQWYDVALSPTVVDAGRSNYTVKARMDWIDGNGNTLKWGTEKTFYIPVQPKINLYRFGMYDIEGNLAAYNGSAGKSGVVYAGQTVYPKYTFSSDSTWTSYNDFASVMYEWKNNAWKETYDMYSGNHPINGSSFYTVNSNLYPYKIPDNSANTNGINRVPVKFASQWVADKSRTYQSLWSDIPIVKADAELYDIRFTDEEGYYLDKDNLLPGQNVEVRYVYRNNTECTIYVNGYDDSRNRISGIYAIPPEDTIEITGYYFEVPDVRSISVWGGVFLDGSAIHDTAYEADGSNNELTVECKISLPLNLTAIEQNAPYRETTDVVTGYWLTNYGAYGYTPDDNISLRFTVFNKSGRQIATKTLQKAIVPANDMNIVYFKWRVPEGLNSEDVVIKAEIIENNIAYNPITKGYTTTPYTAYTTPDTQYEKSEPGGFSASPIPVTEQHYATWWEYTYSDGQFKKVNYGIGIYTKNIQRIEPAAGNSATKSGSTWIMKSGYGISLQSCCCCISVSGFSLPNFAGYTIPQYAYALFPEYNYRYSDNTFQTLTSKIINSYRYWGFPESSDYGAFHFVPIWYPDGKYTVKIVETDCWTPIGMITTTNVPAAVDISGNMYEDHYIGR